MRAIDRPSILVFNSGLDGYFLVADGVATRRATLSGRWARPGDSASLRIELTGRSLPGLNVTEPYPDRRDPKALKIDVTTSDAGPLLLTARVHDRWHDNHLVDRINSTYETAAETRGQVTIPLQAIATGPGDRVLDLGQVAGLILFTSGYSAVVGTTHYITSPRLD